MSQTASKESEIGPIAKADVVCYSSQESTQPAAAAKCLSTPSKKVSKEPTQSSTQELDAQHEHRESCWLCYNRERRNKSSGKQIDAPDKVHDSDDDDNSYKDRGESDNDNGDGDGSDPDDGGESSERDDQDNQHDDESKEEEDDAQEKDDPDSDHD
jgi:hypothetical protein